MSDEKFTTEAAILWGGIPIKIQEKILKNVFCFNCRAVVEIVNYTGIVETGDLILEGSCAVCGKKVVRSLETSEIRRENN